MWNKDYDGEINSFTAVDKSFFIKINFWFEEINE